MIVFFDVLELDGVEMIYKPYATRRETLESVIRVVPGFVRERPLRDSFDRL